MQDMCLDGPTMVAPRPTRRLIRIACGMIAALAAGLALAVPVSAAPIEYLFFAVGQNAAPGFQEIQGPVITIGGTTYGGVGQEIVAQFTFVGDTTDVQPAVVYGAQTYEIRRGVASVTIYDAENGTIEKVAVFDPTANIFVSVDDTNGGVGFGSGAVWPLTQTTLPGNVVYPLGKVLAGPTTYDLKSAYFTAPADQWSGAISCPGFPGGCGAPIALPLVDGETFSMTLPTGQLNNQFIANLMPTFNFSGFNAHTSLTGSNAFSITGRFTLARMSIGINPIQDPVTLTVNGYTVTLPAGSFEQSVTGFYSYIGVVNGSALTVRITPLGGQSFSLVAQGSGVGVGTGAASVKLTIGANSGTARNND